MADKKRDILDKGAILQRDGETYAVTPRIPCGLITDVELLRRIADVAERYGSGVLKITSSQRIALLGIREEDLDRVWADLQMEPGQALGLCIRSVKACPGNAHCRLGLQDSLGLGLKLEQRFVHLPVPNKLKIAVSGCPMDCAESHVRDIGLVGTKKGFYLEVGGSAGAEPRLAQVLAEGLTLQQAEDLVGRIIETYRKMESKKRLGRLLQQMGLEAFRQELELP